MGKTEAGGAPSRRDFIRIVVVSAAAAGTLGVAGCEDDEPEGGGGGDGGPGDAGVQPDASLDPADQLRVFPQGIASGDPSPTSVVLWARIEPSAAGDEPVAYQVATDEAFADVIARGEVTAEAAYDHTLRLKVTDLTAGTRYFYRFRARDVWSETGHTRTAPAADADAPVRFAFASCQDFNGRYYHAWRALVAENPPVDFVVFLGDYIYETAADPRFQDGSPDRQVVLPDGLNLDDEGTRKAALTLADYRSLYKQYRSDPHLREAHRRFPFISIWDDHEFADDSWQDHATHFNEARGDEKSTERRTAANRAWFEYQPAEVQYRADAPFPDDLRIYRSLRFGRHVELFMTDQRSYRDDHVVPEGPLDLDVGKFGENTALGARMFVLKSGFDVREAAARPTMLGATQRSWFLDGVRASTATWKFWGSETQIAQMLVDLTEFELLPDQFRDEFYFVTDQWDGYRSERAAILQELSAVENLVVLTGDIHSYYAAELQVDFDAPGEPVAVEYVTAGISSMPIQEITRRIVADSQTLSGLGLGDLVPRMDQIVTDTNPHYRYVKTHSHGITLVDVSAGAIEVTMLQIADVSTPEPAGPPERVRFRTPAGSNRVERL